MGKAVRFEQCPRCAKKGRDTRGDNLAIYADDSKHCFACGYHVHAKKPLKFLTREVNGNEDKAVLPSDFTREVPAAAWKWLLQYGLSYQYWRPFVGYSEAHDRLVITFGTPVKFSIGRAMQARQADGKPTRKWRFWGDGHSYVEILGWVPGEKPRTLVVVEDIISAHKVAQVTPALCLFGTNVHDLAIKEMVKYNGPVVLWLDEDQFQNLPKKIGRLQTFIKHPVRWVRTPKDPKEYNLEEIKEILKDATG